MLSRSKTCIVCKKRQPIANFYRFHTLRWPRQKRCKRCDNAQRVSRVQAKSLAAGRPTAQWRELERLVRVFLRIDGDTTEIEKRMRVVLHRLDEWKKS